MSHYAEANLSAEQPPSRKNARIQGQDVNQERSPHLEEAAGQGAQTSDAVALLVGQDLQPTKVLRLQNSEEFRRVYEGGRRFDGSWMTVFVLPNSLGFNRLGITASRKVARSAVKRNRAKRLLREAFRLNSAELDGLQQRYDWVLNAKRTLLTSKVFGPLNEFREIVAQVGESERSMV
jgi:ribonuclease P protein component